MERLKRLKREIEKELFTRRAFCGLIFQFFLILMIPLLYIAKYNHIAGDCYWFAYWPHCAWADSHNIFSVLDSALYVVQDFYKSWQGTYSSIFFFALSPIVFGEQYAAVVPYMMIGMTCISTFFLFYVLLRKGLRFDFYTYFSVSCIASLVQFTFMHTPASGLYWYNGAVHYVFMQGFAIISIGLSVLLLMAINGGNHKKTVGYTIVTTVMGFIASGANFSTALLNGECFVLFLIMSLVLWKRCKNKKYLLYLIPFVISEVGFVMNVLAPGNAVRQSYFEKGTVWETILRCFEYSASQAVEWLDIFVWILLIILIPVILKAVSKCTFKFYYPLIFVVGMYCLYASLFAPGFYAFGGSEPLARNQNICKMFLLMGIILCEIYVLGWLEKKFKVVRYIVPVHGKNVWMWTSVLVLSAIIFVVSFMNLDFVEKKATFVSYGAYDVIATGYGESYYQEYLVRLNEYKNNPDKVVYVEPYSIEVYPLWINTETEKSVLESGELSGLLARWYEKDAIIELRD